VLFIALSIPLFSGKKKTDNSQLLSPSQNKPRFSSTFDIVLSRPLFSSTFIQTIVNE
jgi:hypothetical protein